MYLYIFTLFFGIYVSFFSDNLFARPLSPSLRKKEAVIQLTHTHYCTPRKIPFIWNGSIELGNTGSPDPYYNNATLLTINFFRLLAGVAPLNGFSPSLSKRAQEAALMMSTNRRLSHYPTPDWLSYTEEGAEAASRSNLSLGFTGSYAIERYMMDLGSGNAEVGHRRWLLCPNRDFFGIGDAGTERSNYANALLVLSETNRNKTTVPVVWPPPGYVPQRVIFPRWSFAYSGARFENARVQVVKNGKRLPISIEARSTINYCGSALVWNVQEQGSKGGTYRVTLSNVIIEGSPRTFTYSVKSFTLPAQGSSQLKKLVRYVRQLNKKKIRRVLKTLSSLTALVNEDNSLYALSKELESSSKKYLKAKNKKKRRKFKKKMFRTIKTIQKNISLRDGCEG